MYTWKTMNIINIIVVFIIIRGRFVHLFPLMTWQSVRDGNYAYHNIT